MLLQQLTRSGRVAILLITGLIVLWGFPNAARARGKTVDGASAHPVMHWEAQVREYRAPLLTKVHGALVINEKGLEFRSASGHNQLWAFEDIRSAFLAPRRLVLGTYINRSWHRPGTKQYRFDLEKNLPPAVAACLAERIHQPVQNADPDPAMPAIAAIRVRHRTLTRGTNGVLRFRNGGIDYITSSRRDSRSWRWADLQSLSDPDPYQLFIFGYRDTYTFDLKAPLPRTLFNHATDKIYAHSQASTTYGQQTAHKPTTQNTGAKLP